MAMEKLKHFSHECELTSSEIVTYSICNICYKDEVVELACKPCNFELCKPCSQLPGKVSHGFHPEHSLELCVFKYDRKPKYIICSGCGNMFSGSFYKCKTCEIYLDLDCALYDNIFEAWDVKEMLHYSHVHLLKRCRPGQAANGSCLLCELPVSPSSICYGCIPCYVFVHQRCFDLPKEIQHPVHPAHPLKRLNYLRTFGPSPIYCRACRLSIIGIPYGCLECGFDLHFRCADSLLRGLMHKSHEHRLFNVAALPGSCFIFTKKNPCQICLKTDPISLGSFFHCVECNLSFHFECLGIPESLVKKSYHTHPLVRKMLLGKGNPMEYCGVCETMLHSGLHAYTCQGCDFLAHIECILREEEPSPLYIKDLYSCGEDIKGATIRDGHETNNTETKLMVNDAVHVHEMIPNELGKTASCSCRICGGNIFDSACKCTSCHFQTHLYCAELGQSSINRRIHWNHPLTLLPPQFPKNYTIYCESCRSEIRGFNLFCRICNFVIDIKCALKSRHSIGMLGQKLMGEWEGLCINEKHKIVQVIVSRSFTMACAVCFKELFGKALSCMTCGEIYHIRCIKFWRKPVLNHPFHSDHMLALKVKNGVECIACKMNIAKHAYCCQTCEISFHIECIKAVNIPVDIKHHTHYLYNFWMDKVELNRACSVCATPCGASFYGCIDCNFNAHVECVGVPVYVKSQLHQHSLLQSFIPNNKTCSVCGSECLGPHNYSCKHCNYQFHLRCIMPMGDREAATEEEQLCDIYLMCLERQLSKVLEQEQLRNM